MGQWRGFACCQNPIAMEKGTVELPETASALDEPGRNLQVSQVRNPIVVKVVKL